MKTILYLAQIIQILTLNMRPIYGISFVTKPENASFLHGHILYFNCSIDIFSTSGIEWYFTSFSNQYREHHIVQWRLEGNHAVQPGFAVEQPNNLTSNLIILNPSSSSSGKYCCQYKHRRGEKSCAYAKEINLPRNEVVFAGTGVMLNCAEVQAFRWYRYLQTDLLNDKVIYTGSKMADDVDERFIVYTKPDDHPFERLDLYISNVQTDLSGTYKCQQPGMAHCAEVIVLDSEPVCDFHFVRRFGVLAMSAKLTCRIKVTANTVPEMLCSQNTAGNETEHSCSEGRHGVVTCTTDVALEKLRYIDCTIIFNPKPLRKYATCSHVSNQPSYSFNWKPPSDELLLLNSRQFILMALIITVAALSFICILTWMIVLVIQRRKRRKTNAKNDLVSVASNDTWSTESECLSNGSKEKSKITDASHVPKS